MPTISIHFKETAIMYSRGVLAYLLGISFGHLTQLLKKVQRFVYNAFCNVCQKPFGGLLGWAQGFVQGVI